MGKYLGEIAPIYGRWHWPLKAMEPGDWFHVDHAVRPPGEVGHYVNVRATQLGMTLSFMANDPEKAGFAKVTRPDFANQDERPEGAVLEYGVAKSKMLDWYGYDIDQLPVGAIAYGSQQERIDMETIEPPRVRRIIVRSAEQFDYGLRLDGEGFDFIPLPKGATLGMWKSEPLTLDEVMS